MSIPEDMLAMADDLMATLGVSATYRPSGVGPDVPVTVRVKPRQTIFDGNKRMTVMEISVRSSEVADPQYGDVFVIGTDAWKLTSLPVEKGEIMSHAMGALWQLTLTIDARSTMRGGV